MNPENVSSNTAAVAIVTAAALAAGAFAYYSSTSKANKDIEVYNARVRELAKLRKGVNTVVSDVNESNIETAMREFRTNVFFQHFQNMKKRYVFTRFCYFRVRKIKILLKI